MELRDGKAYIHYNGWGTWWDEWIPLDSDWIQCFRSQTIQNAVSPYLSPFPAVPPDAFNNVQISNEKSIEATPEKISLMMKTSWDMIDKLMSMKQLYKKRMRKQRIILHKESLQKHKER